MMSANDVQMCGSLADIILDIWQLVDKIIQQQTLLESWMKGGFMNIAKARYVMGQQCVGENQLPSGDREVSAGLLVIREPSQPQESVTFRAQPQPAGDTEPLRWFSALPPAALRDAQRQFRRAADMGCELATLRSELRAAMERLQQARSRPGQSPDQPTEAERRLAEAVSALSVN